jgi:transcription initiation factor TFIID TATA-box-binding protein
MIKVKVENIVASTTFAEKLDLDIIAQSLEDAEYEPEQFPGLVYRIKEPKVAMLLFSSGKIVCAGAGCTEDVSKAVEKLSKELSSLGLLH